MKSTDVFVGIECWDDLDVRIEALWDDRVVGFASGLLERDSLRLCDLVVEDALPMPRLGGRLKPVHRNFQGQGIGSRVLDCLIMEAQQREVKSIYGFVVERDLRRCPWLLNWYQSRGFIVTWPNPVEPQDDRWFPHDIKILLECSV